MKKPKSLFIFYAVLSTVVCILSIYLMHKVFAGMFRVTDNVIMIFITIPTSLAVLPAIIAGLKVMYIHHFSRESLNKARFEEMNLRKILPRDLLLLLLVWVSSVSGGLLVTKGQVLIGMVLFVLSLCLSLLLTKGLEYLLLRTYGELSG